MEKARFSNLDCYHDFIMLFPNLDIISLDEEMKKKLKEKENLLSSLTDHLDRKNAVQESFKSVHQENAHSQALRKAGEKENSTEMHFIALCDRGKGHMYQEVTRLQEELGSLDKKEKLHETNTLKAHEKLETLLSEMNYDDQMMQDLLDEEERKDEDIFAIALYAMQDKNMIKDLDLSIEKLSVEAEQKKRALENEHINKLTAQISQKRTAEIFQKTHQDRQRQINVWDTTIRNMAKKVNDVQECSKLLSEVRKLVSVQDTQIRRKVSFLNMEIENTKEYQNMINTTEQQCSRLSSEVQGLEETCKSLQEEMESLRRTVISTNTQLKTVRTNINNIKRKTIKQKTKNLEDAQVNNNARKERLESETKMALSVEEAMLRVENMLHEVENCIKVTEGNLQHQFKITFLKRKKEQSLTDAEKIATMELSRKNMTISNLKACNMKIDQYLLVQQEISYRQEFQMQLLEKKLARMSGCINTEEKRILEEKLAELIEAKDKRAKVSTALLSQTVKLQNQRNSLMKDTKIGLIEQAQLTTKIETLKLCFNAFHKDLAKLDIVKKDKMVETNLLKLEVKQVRGLLNTNVDNISSLEKRCLQMELNMKEHLEEMYLHQNMLVMSMRITNKDTEKLCLDLNEKLIKIKKMKSKYETLTMATITIEGLEERSDSYCIVKAALEKEELNILKVNLSAKICKMEKDQKKLEDTMQTVCYSNSAYEKSLHITAPKSCPEYLKKVKLRTEEQEAEEKYNSKLHDVRQLQKECQDLKSIHDVHYSKFCSLKEFSGRLLACICAKEKELDMQKERLGRASKQCSKLLSEIRPSKEKTFEEHVINMRQLKDWKKNINTMVLHANEDNPDLQPLLQTSFEQGNLPLSSLVSCSHQISARHTTTSIRPRASSKN